MSKKIFIINASPRKNWNTDKMCRGFAQGVKNAGGEAEIIYLYDIDFKGCRSCFACKLINGKNYGKCAYPDELKPILEKVSLSDGIVFASPIYFGDVDGVMKSFLERLIFPFVRYDKNYTTIPPKKLKTATIYTMNVPQEIFENDYVKPDNSGAIGNFEKWITHVYEKPKRICAYNTYQFTNYDKYFSEIWDENKKREYLERIFPKELEKAFSAGFEMVKD